MFRFSLLFAAGASISAGAVVYSESFTTDDTGIQPITARNWEGIRSTPPPGVGDPPGNATVVHNSGTYRAGTVGGGNSGPPAVDDYLFAQTQNGTVKEDFFLFSTSTVAPFAPKDYTSLTATWTRNGDTVDAYHLAVQVGTSWYVSQTSYTGSAPGQGPNPALNLLTTNWTNLLVSGTLQLGGTTSTYNDLFGSGAQISGVGFFIDGLAVSGTANRTIRLDNLVIDGVPEPSAAALSILGLTALIGRRRR